MVQDLFMVKNWFLNQVIARVVFSRCQNNFKVELKIVSQPNLVLHPLEKKTFIIVANKRKKKYIIF